MKQAWIAAVVVGMFACSPLWRGRDAFLSQLRCGMSERELAVLVRHESVDEFGKPRLPSGDTTGSQYYLIKGDTSVSFQFDGKGRLIWYAVGSLDSNESDNSKTFNLCAEHREKSDSPVVPTATR